MTTKYKYSASVAQKGERKARLFTNGFESTIPCKRCGTDFDSTDRRAVRHCDRCRIWLADQDERLGVGGEFGA